MKHRKNGMHKMCTEVNSRNDRDCTPGTVTETWLRLHRLIGIYHRCWTQIITMYRCLYTSSLVYKGFNTGVKGKWDTILRSLICTALFI